MAVGRIQFILKRREDFDPATHTKKNLSTGLYNSASFVVQALQCQGLSVELSIAQDNNCIDRLVTEYRPTTVIIEALWVVPQKFRVLCELHPQIQWIIRLHSELPFLAGEGQSMDWIADYVTYHTVTIAVNAPRLLCELRQYLQAARGWSQSQARDRVIYLPNTYPRGYAKSRPRTQRYWADIACFGAVRPLKNHLVQALAALKFCERRGLQLRFHINQGRVEMQGQPAANNLLSMFEQLSQRGHQLIQHSWQPREQFLETCAAMDLGLQANFSETFNIVSADLVSQGVPVVGTREIPWLNTYWAADASSSDSIAEVMDRAWRWSGLNVWTNQRSLNHYCDRSEKIWLEYFGRQQ